MNAQHLDDISSNYEGQIWKYIRTHTQGSGSLTFIAVQILVLERCVSAYLMGHSCPDVAGRRAAPKINVTGALRQSKGF